jgi:hypothetical protein
MDLVVALVNSLRGRDVNAPLLDPGVPEATPVVSMTPVEREVEQKRLMTLEDSTREFAKAILIWARANGIPATLGETYRSKSDQDKVDPRYTAVPKGKIGWHQVGRAFHVVIRDADGHVSGPYSRAAHARLGEEVRRRGGVWLGDKVIQGPVGPIIDLMHYEYHPGLFLSSYRGSKLASRELSQAEKRAVRYG